MKKFFSVLLAFLLVAVIVGGIGYIGYTSLFMNNSGNAANNNSSNANAAKEAKTTDTTSKDSMAGMNGGSQNQQGSTQQSTNNSIGLMQANIILQNKDSLDKSISTLKEALKLMTVDPYAPTGNTSSSTNNGGNTQNPQTNQQDSQKTVNPQPTPGNNTIINIYPQATNGNNTQGVNGQSTVMQNMGTSYDPNKMEQLHNGLYKISLGMAFLDQLQSQLVSQAENATSNTQNLVQYYTNQYYLTAQNKNKINQVLTYVNEAANLININPYIATNGLVYDKDRMNQIHQSVFKLAQGIAAINLLNDDFTKQAVTLSNTAQNYLNNANLNNTNTSQMNMSTGLFGGLFDSIKISSVVNIVLILFVVGLILGILGFIYSLIKPSNQRNQGTGNKEII